MTRAPVFRGFTATLVRLIVSYFWHIPLTLQKMSLVLPMLRLSHVGEGYAVVLKGKACVERRKGDV
jgi:hypothetical protein